MLQQLLPYCLHWEEMTAFSHSYLAFNQPQPELLSCRDRINQLGGTIVKTTYTVNHHVITARIPCSSFQQADELKRSWMVAMRLGDKRAIQWIDIDLELKSPAGQFTVRWQQESSNSWHDLSGFKSYADVRDRILASDNILVSVKENPKELTRWHLRRSFRKSAEGFEFYRELTEGQHGPFIQDSPTFLPD